MLTVTVIVTEYWQRLVSWPL